MSEEKQPIEEIRLTRDIKSVSPEEANAGFVEGDLNIVPFNPPTLSGGQIIKGLGGKFLEQDTLTSLFSTTNSAFQDVTGLSVTKNINNRRVLLLFSGTISSNVDGGLAYLTFDIDGTNQGGASGMVFFQQTKAAGTSQLMTPFTMAFVTGLLVGSHTFKVQLASDGTNTASLRGGAKGAFVVIELSD